MRRPFFLALLLGFCTASLPAYAAPQFLDDEAEVAVDVDFRLQKAATGAFTLDFDYQGPKKGYQLEATPGGAAFYVWKAGQRRLLSSAKFSWKPQTRLTLQRRAWMMRLIADDRVVLSAFDSTYQAGKIGAEPGAWKWSDARVQPVENIRFDDDFTRDGSAGEEAWTPNLGPWKLSASSTHVNARTASMSSNPFAYEVQAPKTLALSSAGRKFWDSYDARVAARPTGRGVIGIAAYVQDPKNYLAFTWSGVEGPQARRLIRVRNGVSTTLTSASGAYLPRGWSEIGIRTSPGSVEAILDGAPVLRARDDSFGRGPVALLAQNMETASFDDVRVRSAEFFRPNRTVSDGAWTQNGQFALTGRGDMDNYRLSAPLQGAPSGAFGLVAGWKDASNYALFRAADPKSSAPFRGRAQIVHVLGGQTKTLFDAPLPPLPSGARLTLRAQNGLLTIQNGEQTLAQAAAPALTRGQAGVWNPAAFAPESALYFAPPPEAPKVAARMEDDAYMVGWASATGEWPPTPGDNGLEFWNNGEFFGSATLGFPWRADGAGLFNRGSFEVALRAARGNFGSGQILRGESSEDQKVVKWTLRRGNTLLASATSKLAPSGEGALAAAGNFKIALDEDSTTLFAGDTPILTHVESGGRVANQLALTTGLAQAKWANLSAVSGEVAPETTSGGHCIAVRSQGFRVRADRLRAWSSNRDDSTFTGAPVDFYSTSGRWSIFSRWPCYGDWSFFGGAGKAPVLWSKRTYGGDIVAEMYAHPQMILPKEPGYGHPGDLNISLAGDGKNLSSGYSFVLAGWDNTRSKLMRGSQVIAENTGSEAYFQDAISNNMKWHRKWFYIRAQARRAVKDGKSGVELRLTLDDNEILRAFDPDPLPHWERGGRVAFWTLDSTLMIARAKVEAQQMGAKTLPAGLLNDAQGSLVITSKEFERVVVPVPGDGASSAVVTKQKAGWKIQNAASGGIFSVQLGLTALEVTPQSRLEIDAQIPEGVKIDAYIQLGDAMSTLEMTGNQRPDAMALPLGKMTRAGNKWSFPLGAALQKRFPNQKAWKLDALSLGARHGDAYRWLGFDGNALGASYQVSGWRLVG